MKKDLLKKMKYEMPGMSKGKGPAMPEEDMEVEISLGEEPEETGMPEMAEEMDMEEGEMESPDLSAFSEEELMAEIKKRKSAPKMA
jgi:hypothetical protein